MNTATGRRSLPLRAASGLITTTVSILRGIITGQALAMVLALHVLGAEASESRPPDLTADQLKLVKDAHEALKAAGFDRAMFRPTEYPPVPNFKGAKQTVRHAHVELFANTPAPGTSVERGSVTIATSTLQAIRDGLAGSKSAVRLVETVNIAGGPGLVYRGQESDPLSTFRILDGGNKMYYALGRVTVWFQIGQLTFNASQEIVGKTPVRESEKEKLRAESDRLFAQARSAAVELARKMARAVALIRFELLDPQKLYNPDDGDSLRLPAETILRAGTVAQIARFAATDINGVATDGASLVLLRVRAPVAGKVKFSLERQDGGLYPLISNPFKSVGAKTVETETQPDPRGDKDVHFAFALYRPPGFFRNVPSPEARFTCSFTPKSGNRNQQDRSSVKLVRPPVVLVHGTYDKPSVCWDFSDPRDTSKMKTTERLARAGFEYVSAVDWESTNGNQNPSAFQDNLRTVWANRGGIREILEKMRSAGIVVTQADLVCHSQGGVISRVYARGYDLKDKVPAVHFSDPGKCIGQGCHYHGRRNYGAGDIHRLITISATHMGSDICRLFRAYEKYSNETKSISGAWLDLFRAGIHYTSSGIFTGGFEDQVPGSPALRKVGPTPIPAHAIACVGDDNVVRFDYDGDYLSRLRKIYLGAPTQALLTILRSMGDEERKQADYLERLSTVGDIYSRHMNALFAVRKAVFGGEENDCTVRISSSFGGLAEAYRTRIPDVAHGWAPRYRTVQLRMLDLLRDDGRLFDSNGFPDAYTGEKSTIASAIRPIDWSRESIATALPYPDPNDVPKTMPREEAPPRTESRSVGQSDVTNTARRESDDARQSWDSGGARGASQKSAASPKGVPSTPATSASQLPPPPRADYSSKSAAPRLESAPKATRPTAGDSASRTNEGVKWIGVQVSFQAGKLVIQSVEPGSLAARQGLMPGDVIEAILGEPPGGNDRDAAALLRPTGPLDLEIQRGGKSVNIEFKRR